MTDWNEAESRHLLNMGALERMDDWQPIETAPTDQPILVYGAKRLHWAVAAYTSRDGWQVETCSDWHSIYPPTHWMPLPEPPTTK